MRLIYLTLYLILFSSALTASTIQGFWKSMSDETGKPEAIVAIYPYHGKYYGRIVATYNDQGVLSDSIYAPIGRATGIEGNPFYAGLDIIFDLKKDQKDTKHYGRICDPEKGRIYDTEVWREGDHLIVRGKFLFFGRNQTWLPVTEKDVPADFKKPDISTFVPTIPKPRSTWLFKSS